MGSLNYGNIDSKEFEALAKDVMNKLLHKNLERFGSGKDCGIDLVDDTVNPTIIVQCKHYNSSSDAVKALLHESKKIEKIASLKEYYIFTSASLLPQQVSTLCNHFEKWMSSDKQIVYKEKIEDFFADSDNKEILEKHIALFVSLPYWYKSGESEEDIKSQALKDLVQLEATLDMLDLRVSLHNLKNGKEICDLSKEAERIYNFMVSSSLVFLKDILHEDDLLMFKTCLILLFCDCCKQEISFSAVAGSVGGVRRSINMIYCKIYGIENHKTDDYFGRLNQKNVEDSNKQAKERLLRIQSSLKQKNKRDADVDLLIATINGDESKVIQAINDGAQIKCTVQDVFDRYSYLENE